MYKRQVLSAYTPTYGGVAEGILKMTMGNDIGFDYNKDLQLDTIFGYNYGGFIVEVEDLCTLEEMCIRDSFLLQQKYM